MTAAQQTSYAGPAVTAAGGAAPLGRYGEDRIRKVAKRLKADLVRAA